LIELLVVIAIIAILAALLIPAINAALLRARIAKMVSNGRQIYMAIVSYGLETGVQGLGSNPWPQSKDYANATDYCRWLVTNEVIDADFSFFAGPDVPPYQGLSAAAFTSNNNAWAFALDVTDETRSGTPVIFARNLVFEDDVLNGVPAVRPGVAPFGNRAAVIIVKGGAGFSLRPNEVTTNNVNPVAAPNAILYP
jgi:type II secretory pathway pseudopilin PulG